MPFRRLPLVAQMQGMSGARGTRGRRPAIQGRGGELREGPSEGLRTRRHWAELRQKQGPTTSGPGSYRLLHSGCAQVGLLVACRRGGDGCGSRCLVN